MRPRLKHFRERQCILVSIYEPEGLLDDSVSVRLLVGSARLLPYQECVNTRLNS
jgi:hypothetical protein